MKKAIALLLLTSTLLLTGCQNKSTSSDNISLVSIQVVDRNGFVETVSAKDRLKRYKDTDFLTPQPYQKVLRVFGKSSEGTSSSKVTSYHSNGLIWQFLEVIDGRAHGIYREWHPNGTLKLSFSVIEGAADLSESAISSWVFEGKNSIWDEEGDLIAEIFYEKGMLQGDSLYYHKNGNLKKKVSYKKDLLQGDSLVFSATGTLLAKTSFVDDKPHGESFSYKEDGSPLYEELFDKGLLLEGTYYNSKTGDCISSIKNGYGKRAEFNEGVLEAFVEYKKGLPEGLVESFNPDGVLTESYEQREGLKNGTEKIYYLERPGSLKISLEWQDDTLQGTIKTWFLNGSQESERKMYQNKKNGPFLAWYESGDLMLQEEYEADLLMEGSYYKKGDHKTVSRIKNGKGTASIYNAEGYFLKKIPYEKGVPIIETDLLK